MTEHDAVSHPAHYTSSPARCSGCGKPIECIDITRHQGFNLGNATKYVWRCDLKADAIEDLEKAVWYLQDEIAERRRRAAEAEKAERIITVTNPEDPAKRAFNLTGIIEPQPGWVGAPKPVSKLEWLA